jgi:HD-GYP domain-containing protein (c-di-GMP phosphodiesterase class II)
MFQQSIKTKLLTVFIVLTLVISSALMLSQYYFNKQLAIRSTTKDFSLIAKNISNHLDLVNARIKSFFHAVKTDEALYKKIQADYKHPALNSMIQLINIDPYIYALYFTDAHNNFYELINIQTSTQLYTQYNAPKATRWIVLIKKGKQTFVYFLNKQKILLSYKEIDKEINPPSRIWYKKAISSNSIISTGVYTFNSSNVNGFTFATKLNKEGYVFAIDYTVNALNSLLKAQSFGNHSHIFIFNKESKIIASSQLAYTNVDSALIDAFKQKKKEKILFYKKNGEGFLSIYKPLANEMYLGISLKAHPLFAPYIESIKYSFMIAFLVLLITIPMIFLVTKMIVKPIKALIHENEKIKNRNFKEVKSIQTNVVEFIELSESFVHMSASIHSYQKSQAELLNSIVKLIAEAVDAKSHYTGGHCERVPQIAELLIKAANRSNLDVFKDFHMESEEQLKEFSIGAWLHDCGKVTTPEYVVDKATKLETINNRIHEIRTRFELLWRDAQIEYLEAILANKDKNTAQELLTQKQKQLKDDFAFIAKVNIGGEFMSEEKKARVLEIASQEWLRYFDDTLGLGELEHLRLEKSSQDLPVKEQLLSDKPQHLIQREYFNYEEYKKQGFKEKVPQYLYNYGEIYNLCIEKGTLTAEERYKINEHVIMSIKMLEKIPFPPNMKKVPQYAGTHHETLKGTGYPRQLTKDELSIPARVMAIADIFEALTASDRPYKKAKTLSEALKIMSNMVKDQDIDGDLFELFLREEIYMQYAQEFLTKEQIDKIEIEEYLSC